MNKSFHSGTGRARLVLIMLFAAATLLMPASGLAVHDLGLFELDTTAPQFANTADDSGPGAPYDWESIFDANGQQILTSSALLTAEFSADSATPDQSYFATSNKDIDDVSTWQCGAINNPTPKDEISNAYAALFVNPANQHVILYAGVERDSNNGNSFAGFWIFKGGVGCNSPGNFSGSHTQGDILVLSNFTGGGNHPLVEVFTWDSILGLVPVTSGNFCHAALPADDVCGEVNGGSFTTAWAPHNAVANPLLQNEFLEIGVDLTSSLGFAGNSIPCFARFQAETRSSQETTATLKDYAGGPFNTCTTSTVTTPIAGGTSVSGGSVFPGTSVTDRAVITGSALIGAAPPPAGSVSFFLCGPQPTKAQAQCSTGGTAVGGPVNLPGVGNPQTVFSSAVAPTAIGWYCFRAEYSGDGNYIGGSADSSLNECFEVVKAPPNVTTFIHSATHSVVTVVEVGSTVHDLVSVTGAVGTPSGNVRLDWFTNGTCTGAAAATSANLALNANGQLDATPFPRGPLATGAYGFKAHYLGDAVYLAGDGACEPLQVVDANIQITPPTKNNPVSTNHTLTGHVNVNAFGGYVNAPNGTTITFTLSGAGSFVGPSSCTTAGGTGSCSVVISSSASGLSTIRAKTDVPVTGLTLHRESGDGKAGDSVDASKLWGDATARTDILNASGAVVTTVVSGTVVHDKVFVARIAGTPAAVPNPTGSVIFHRYATIDCTGTATNQTVALTPGSPSTAVSDDFAPTANMSYQAEYLGDPNYPARLGACEPLTVTPVPNPVIAIVKNPKGQTVAVGGTATFTITVTNAGNTVLTDVTVTDPLSPNCNRTKVQIPALASMAPSAKVTYTCTRPNVRANFDNVATATGTPPSGPNVTASDTAPVKAQALKPAKKKVKKKKKPKVVSHKKPKATG